MVGVALMKCRAMSVNGSCCLSCADRQLSYVKYVVSSPSLILLKELISPSLSHLSPPPPPTT